MEKMGCHVFDACDWTECIVRLPEQVSNNFGKLVLTTREMVLFIIILIGGERPARSRTPEFGAFKK